MRFRLVIVFWIVFVSISIPLATFSSIQPLSAQSVSPVAVVSLVDQIQNEVDVEQLVDDAANIDEDAVASHSELVDAVNQMDRVLSGAPVEPVSNTLRNRLVAVGFFGGVLLAVLGVLFGYLRLDHATRGFHSGRLQMVAIGVIVLVALIGYLLWTQFLF